MSKIQDIQTILGVTADGKWGPKSQAALDFIKQGDYNTPPVLSPDSGLPVDTRSEGNIATLHAKVQPLARQLVRDAAEHGIVIKVTSGTRTYAEQDKLFAQGGVTKARGGQSNHNFGLAFDVTEFDGANPVWDGPNYRTVGKLGKALGLSWGGDWTSIMDEPHFELRPQWASALSESQMLTELRHRHDSNTDAFA